MDAAMRRGEEISDLSRRLAGEGVPPPLRDALQRLLASWGQSHWRDVGTNLDCDDPISDAKDCQDYLAGQVEVIVRRHLWADRVVRLGPPARVQLEQCVRSLVRTLWTNRDRLTCAVETADNIDWQVDGL